MGEQMEKTSQLKGTCRIASPITSRMQYAMMALNKLSTKQELDKNDMPPQIVKQPLQMENWQLHKFKHQTLSSLQQC